MISILSAAVSAPTHLAPFKNEEAMREFSDFLLARIGDHELAAARNLATKNSHLDDDITQQNLHEVFNSLRKLLGDGEALKAQFVQESRFGRSFIRHQFSLERPLDQSWQPLRCMITYRRKTDGWRLNQLWCS